MTYEYYNNCKLKVVGDGFRTQPVGIAVAKGSSLTDALQGALLSLLDVRVIDSLYKKHWNVTVKKTCPVIDDTEGITLTSLGGVFIVTSAGLAFAAGVLACELWSKKDDVQDSAEQAARRVGVSGWVDGDPASEGRQRTSIFGRGGVLSKNVLKTIKVNPTVNNPHFS